MKYKVFLFSLAVINILTYTCDEETTNLLISARTDQQDLTSIKSMQFSQNFNDKTLNEALKNTPYLFTLTAPSNMLKNPNPIPCAYLETIDFSNGKIEKFILGEWIEVMPKLRVLKLRENNISSIASDFDTERSTCGPCGRKTIPSWSSIALQEIDLSNNKLEEFDLNLLNNATNLVDANFSNNTITRVVIPKSLNHRKLCNVFLQNNQLKDSDKFALEKCNSLDTKQYEWSLWRYQAIGLTFGILTGFGTVIKISSAVHSLWTIPIALGSFFAQAGVGFILGHGIKKCEAYDTVHTYKPFIFVFDDQKVKDYVTLPLEQ